MIEIQTKHTCEICGRETVLGKDDEPMELSVAIRTGMCSPDDAYRDFIIHPCADCETKLIVGIEHPVPATAISDRLTAILRELMPTGETGTDDSDGRDEVVSPLIGTMTCPWLEGDRCVAVENPNCPEWAGNHGRCGLVLGDAE